jgi:hypothetical protein
MDDEITVELRALLRQATQQELVAMLLQAGLAGDKPLLTAVQEQLKRGRQGGSDE